MNPTVSSDTFNWFFAWAPWVVGAAIYFAFYVAKRHESASGPPSIGQTFSCAVCGRRGTRDQMVPQDHGGAIGWQCPHCAAGAQAPAH